MRPFHFIRCVALVLLAGCGGIDVSREGDAPSHFQLEGANGDCASMVETGASGETQSGGCNLQMAEDHCWLAVPDGGFADRTLATNASAFTASVSIVPSVDGVDGVIGLSAGAASTADDLAVALRFNADGSVDARNGDAYASVNPLRYAAGNAFRVLFVVDAAGRAYSAWVNGRLLAKAYAFHGEPGAALDRFTTSVNSDAGALRACSFATSSDERLTWLHHDELYPEPGGAHALAGLANGGLLVTGSTGTAIVDASGNVVTTFMQGGNGIALDAAQNRYLFGEFTGTYDSGDGAFASAGGSDVFVSKYDAQFAHVFTRAVGGSGDDRLGAFDVNAAGHVVVLVGTTLVRFDDSGVLLWTRSTGDAHASVALDAAGNAYLAENAANPAGFTLTALDPQNTPIWTRRGTTTNNGAASVLALRPAPGGGVALAGSISGTLDLGGAPLRAARTDRSETFVAWLDPNGAYLDGAVVDLTPNSGLGVDDTGTATLGGYRANPNTYLLERVAFDGSSVTGVSELGGHELTRGLFLGTAAAPSVDRVGNAYWPVTARMLPEQSASFLLKVAP